MLKKIKFVLISVALISTSPVFAIDSTDRPIRRTDYELSQKEALYVVQNTKHAVLATSDKTGVPYAVPITPIYFKGKIYFHGTNDRKSRKLINLNQNPNVSIAWIGTSPIKEDEFTVKYVSAIVAGKAKQVTNEVQRQKIFEEYTAQITPSQSKEKQLETIKGSIKEAALWEVEIEKLTGKAKAKQPFFKKFK